MKNFTSIKKLTASLMFLTLLTGCGTKSNVCPEFPVPSEHVAAVLGKLAIEDAEVARWGNDLLRLQEKLDECEDK